MTRNAFVIGHPIAHSRSPLIHNHWIKTHDLDGAYSAIDVSTEQLPDFLNRVRTGEFVGGNITIPHKEAVFALCDTIDSDAKTIGAVNTLVMRETGLHGFNTDLSGFLGNLDQNAPGWDKSEATAPGAAIVLGAGGAARAVLMGLAKRGFSPIYILNRTVEKAQALAKTLPGPFQAYPLSRFDDLAAKAHLLVNTTSIGMHSTRFEGLNLNKLPASALVTDIVYTPLQTPLLADAKARGLETVDGLGMLLHQAVPGFEAWFECRPEVTPQLRGLAEQSLGAQ